MLLASWNLNSLTVRLPHLLSWLEAVGPDVVGLQETKLTDDAFPVEALRAAGYHATYSGQKTYNGVAILTRGAPVGIVTDMPDFSDPQRRMLAVTTNGLRFINLYVPNGQEVGSDKYRYKLDWLDAMHGYLETELSRHTDLVVVGDFNIAPDDRDIHDPDAWRGKILCSDAERAALTRISGLGLTDTFRLFDDKAGTFSWWDYRAGGFRRNHGLRIDLILASERMRERCIGATVDAAPRAWERPSDHTPVVARFS